MGIDEISRLETLDADNRPSSGLVPELTPQQIDELPISARIAMILLQPRDPLLLETLYEGSSFTPTIGYELGYTVTDQHSLDPVREGLKDLRMAGALTFERDDMTVTETRKVDDGHTTKEVQVSSSVIQVVVATEKMQAFLAKKIADSK